MCRVACLSFPIAGFLLFAQAAAQEPTPQAPKTNPVVKVATLGASTRAPTKAEVEALGLKFEVRAKGQVVVEVTKDGAASKAGLVAGDAVVKFEKVEVFSQDDIADFLRASSPGQKVEATVVRAGSRKEEVLLIALGSVDVEAPKSAGLQWQYTSFANLDAALAKAKEEKKLVLVGLSGAET